MAPRWTYLDPQVFSPLVSFQTVIMALVGGAASLWGPVLGAAFLGLAGEILLVKFRYLYMWGWGSRSSSSCCCCRRASPGWRRRRA